MELVTEHPLLFMDELTTDLDFRTTTDIILVREGVGGYSLSTHIRAVEGL
jgi:ABC-type cobalamin/Fe3+-siderophores transport system ATPase subunit